MRTGSPGHLKSFDYLGPYRYFLTFCTDRRTRVFISLDRFQVVWQQILRSAADEQMAIVAYCFMPDHVHLLIEGQSEASDCRAFIKRAKQLSGYHYEQTYGVKLWQRYGFERVLRDDEATLSVARYIFANPVRARLVERVEDYPYVGSAIYSTAQVLEAIQMAAWST